MASAFDRWEKDPFFYAAEEVQESADRYQISLGIQFCSVPFLKKRDGLLWLFHFCRMESAYRRWMHEKEGAEVRRELHIALGTAKWQVSPDF